MLDQDILYGLITVDGVYLAYLVISVILLPSVLWLQGKYFKRKG